MKKFEPLYPPKGQFTFLHVVELGGHPYAVYNEKQADMRNNWLTVLHLVPFAEENLVPEEKLLPDRIKLRRKL